MGSIRRESPNLVALIRSFKRAMPFTPFRIVLKSASVCLDDGELILLNGAQCILIAYGGVPRFMNQSDVVAVELIQREPKEVAMLDTIKVLKHRDPFIQFQIVMTSGDRYLIENPDLLAIGKSEMTYYFPKSNRVAFLRTNQVASVEQLEEKPAT